MSIGYGQSDQLIKRTEGRTKIDRHNKKYTHAYNRYKPYIHGKLNFPFFIKFFFFCDDQQKKPIPNNATAHRLLTARLTLRERANA